MLVTWVRLLLVFPFFEVFNSRRLFICDVCIIQNVAGSTFMLGRCLTSLFWGTIADRIGRKPVIVIGITSV